jgi:hypothetical protein
MFILPSSFRGYAMRKTVTALAAAATLATATLAAPRTADARWGWWGPALGGLAVGAIVGSALARPYYGYGYGGYPYYGTYYAPAPVYYSYYAPAYYGYYGYSRPYGYGCWRRGYYGHRYRVC